MYKQFTGVVLLSSVGGGWVSLALGEGEGAACLLPRCMWHVGMRRTAPDTDCMQRVRWGPHMPVVALLVAMCRWT